MPGCAAPEGSSQASLGLPATLEYGSFVDPLSPARQSKVADATSPPPTQFFDEWCGRLEDENFAIGALTGAICVAAEEVETNVIAETEKVLEKHPRSRLRRDNSTAGEIEPSSNSLESGQVPASSSTLKPKRWSNLQGRISHGPVNLDDDVDQASELLPPQHPQSQPAQPSQSQPANAPQQNHPLLQSKGCAQNESLTPSSQRPAGVLSAKDFLARFRKRTVATAQKGLRMPLPQHSYGGSSSSSSKPKPEEQKLIPVKQEADTSPPRRKRRMEKSAEAPPPEPERPRSTYMLDVSQLVPKAARDSNKWKESHPEEYRAMVASGDPVSPSVNVLVTSKKKKDAATEATKRARRTDDTDERAFKRRQSLNAGAETSSVAALRPKQQVDQFGILVKKSEEVKPKEEVKAEKKAVPSRLQDSIQVAEGLRCPRWLWQALYPYQHTCVKWLWGLQREKTGGILADEMGLGKTVQIVAYLAALHFSGVLQNMKVQNTSLGPASMARTGGVLIVCPATLISQWRNELFLWYPPIRVCVMHQVTDAERKEAIEVASTNHGVLLTSYETMRTANEELYQASWVMVILDEGQKIRNPNANVTIAAKRFSTPHRLVLSGSPIQNNLQELWSLFDFISPGRLGTLPVFMEEFATPIEQGNVSGATEMRVATAYQCALALRELTQPCILRRTKAECMDVLRLPHKQEQVLFCTLSPEQYSVYIHFLQSEQVRRARSASRDRSAIGAVLFAISVLRKLCNHPDLLLKDADERAKPADMWNPERSGKMKVLAEILKLWHADKHRALIFVQTVQMLEVIQRWMTSMEYTHLRLDGTTPVKRRLALIDEFNSNPGLFAMVLTTRVGGVGLNIIGADRVVIFDPDWNPMTDVQARERTWRIGQKRDVAIYRLVQSGTVEEKIYQRQVYKHFLSQKVLNDPRQRQFFKWNDLADLFDVPPTPPNFNPADMRSLKEQYSSVFQKLSKSDECGDGEVETTEVMRAIADLPTSAEHVSKETTDEHNAILQTLYDSNGIKASFNHDKVEQSLLDRKIVREGANLVATRALAALKRSARERAGHHISEPTWTGQQGLAGKAAKMKVETGQRVKCEVGFDDRGELAAASRKAGVSSADIIDGLRQLAAIRAATRDHRPSQSGDAVRLGLVTRDDKAKAMPALAEADYLGTPLELHESDKRIAEAILHAFLNPKLASEGYSLTTGQVLQYLSNGVAAHHTDLFKSLLKQMCVLTKSLHPSEPSTWTLRKEFWPKKGQASDRKC